MNHFQVNPNKTQIKMRGELLNYEKNKTNKTK